MYTSYSIYVYNSISSLLQLHSTISINTIIVIMLIIISDREQDCAVLSTARVAHLWYKC